MGNLQYRSTVWICQHLCEDSDCSQDTCHPIALFKFMVYDNNITCGHYAIYITWLHQHFPSEGLIVFRYLKKHYSNKLSVSQHVNMSLNLFDVPDIDYRYEAKRWIPFKPANTGSRPILFTVPSGDDYYDLNETKLEIKIRMNTTGANGLSADETDASDGDNTKYIYCVNNFGHSLFNQMNVSFNGVLMREQSNAYHQKAYLETLQNFNRQQGETTLVPQGWVNELNVAEELTPTNAGNNDKPNPNNWSGKTGLKALTSRLLGKAYHTFMIKPYIAVLKTGKCLVPGVQIDLELYLNDSNLFLFGTPDTTTSVGKNIPTLGDNDLSVTLWMKNVTLNASVYSRLQKERTLSKTKKVQYPVDRSEIRTYSFDGNTRDEKLDLLHF